jgi:hypothetical protein
MSDGNAGKYKARIENINKLLDKADRFASLQLLF